MPGRVSVFPVAFAHELSAVGAADGEALHHEVAFGEELVHVAVPIWAGPPDYRGRVSEPFRPARGAGGRGVVVDEVRV